MISSIDVCDLVHKNRIEKDYSNKEYNPSANMNTISKLNFLGKTHLECKSLHCSKILLIHVIYYVNYLSKLFI